MVLIKECLQSLESVPEKRERLMKYVILIGGWELEWEHVVFNIICFISY